MLVPLTLLHLRMMNLLLVIQQLLLRRSHIGAASPHRLALRRQTHTNIVPPFLRLRVLI